MLFDTGDEFFDILLFRRLADTRLEGLCWQTGRPAMQIEQHRQHRDGSHHDEGKRRARARPCALFRVAGGIGRQQPAGNLGAGGSGLGIADEAALQILLHFVKLVPIDRDVTFRPAAQAAGPAQGRKHKGSRHDDQQGCGDPEKQHTGHERPLRAASRPIGGRRGRVGRLRTAVAEWTDLSLM